MNIQNKFKKTNTIYKITKDMDLEGSTLIIPVGLQYFDTTISKPIYWTGTGWVDSTGVTV